MQCEQSHLLITSLMISNNPELKARTRKHFTLTRAQKFQVFNAFHCKSHRSLVDTESRMSKMWAWESPLNALYRHCIMNKYGAGRLSLSTGKICFTFSQAQGVSCVQCKLQTDMNIKE